MLVCICHTSKTKIPGRYHARAFKFGKTQGLLNSLESPGPSGLSKKAALCFWAGAQAQKLLLCCQKRDNIHILVTLLYKEYCRNQENTAKCKLHDTSDGRAQVSSKWEITKVYLKKERDLARSGIKRKRQSRYTFKCYVRETFLIIHDNPSFQV